jgi:ribonuclease-3
MSCEALASVLGCRFSKPELLRQALTHRSFGQPHNERLEFLGDALLNCVIADRLCQRFPDLPEGDLSRLRASLVRQDTLAEIAREIHLGEYLRLGEGELKSGGASRPSMLADAMEAIFAAVYLDAGFAAVQALVERLFAPWLAKLDPKQSGKDAKTALQELVQGRRLPLPQYALLAVRGEAHAQEFEVECVIPALDIRCFGSGSSRRMAEQQAARQALSIITS